MAQKVTVVGGGLAGTECAYQLAEAGLNVELVEMRKADHGTPAHVTKDLGELVCSNSFGSKTPGSAPAQLKWEAAHLNSLIVRCAYEAKVDAGQALAVDRAIFSRRIEEELVQHPRITLSARKIDSIDEVEGPAVFATGPLTSAPLSEDLQRHCGRDFLYFFDAIAPIISADSIDRNIVWAQDRYDKGPPDYLNCPLEKEHYVRLLEEVTACRKVVPKEFEKTMFFEGCMPIEEMIERGPQTLRFGPMKPVGLTDPRTGRKPYAAVQLRRENAEGTSYNMVGFQTRMAYGEQVRIFRGIPGLENAEFLKLGSMHRNLFVNSPMCLDFDLSLKDQPLKFLAGQITGVEGYFESTCIGLLVARFLVDKLAGRVFNPPPRTSAMGSLLYAITDIERAKHFQPTNINFGLFPRLAEEPDDKHARREGMIAKAQADFRSWSHGKATSYLNPQPSICP